MINPDINRFLGTLLYPITDSELLFDDPLAAFFARLPRSFITPDAEKALNENKKRVFDAAAGYIARHYSVDSYDQIFQYMERWYLGRSVWRGLPGRGPDETPSLYDVVFHHLRRLSRSMISKLDGQIIYKYWETGEDALLLGGFAKNDKIHLFRSLNQMIPMDLLAAIFVMDNPDAKSALDSFYGQISITDAPLEQILCRGIAENHLHMGAATSFSTMWEDLMRPEVSLTDQSWQNGLPLKSPGAPPKSVLYFYWLMARCLRMYLAICVPIRSDLCGGVDAGDAAGVAQALFPENLRALYSFLRGRGEEIDYTLNYFRKIERALSGAIMESGELTALLRPEETLRLTEGHFLLRLFAAFSRPPSSGLAFQKGLFLQYLRIKHSMFRLMVQAKTVSGLDHFQLYYDSASGVNRASAAFGRNIPSDSLLFFERQIRSQLSTPHIRRIEFRTSFFEREGDARAFLSGFLRAYRKILYSDYCARGPDSKTVRPVKKFPRVGIVFHFLKSLQETPDVCFYSEDSALRAYSELHSRYKLQLEIFKKLRNPAQYPGIDRYLVGIDVASLENSVPTWVFRDIYENARDAKSEPFFLSGKRPFQSLGFTFHAGEDFRHLLSGLRRVYEVVHYLKFHAGDRIGHGLALGILADDWCAEHPNVILPRIEALENYLWAYSMLSTYPSEQNTGNLLYLEQRIHELSGDIFRVPRTIDGEEPSIHISTSVLLRSYRELFRKDPFGMPCGQCAAGRGPADKHECPLLLKLQNPPARTGSATPFSAEDVVMAYHCFHFANRMNEPVHYHLGPQEILILKELQAMMQGIVSKAGIIVEANPSSNVVIGHIDTMHDHPLYQFSSCRCDYKDIMVCINSDDPGVFQTNTANELGIAYMGMVERGIGRDSCLEWIDRLRDSGMRSSFIRRTDSDEELLQELDELIREL